jgi:hypothetical protein
MHFNPVLIGSGVFSEEDRLSIQELVAQEDKASKTYFDGRHQRDISRYKELSVYADKLLPVAREIFKDPTLKNTYNVFLSYGKDSTLTFHKDHNACVYTIDYCVSSNIDWPLIIENQEFNFSAGQALAFMGGHDLHGRNPMPDVNDARVENIMFHYCPEDHWYFTEGPGYFKVLAERGEIPTY